MNSIANPGDIKINNITVYNNEQKYVDITRLTLGFTIFEELMNPFVTASLVISDSIALSSMLPLMGEEQVIIDFETPFHKGNEYRFKKQFYIHKVENIENYKEKNSIISLQLISVEGFVDKNKRISQTFKGSASEIVSKLLKEPQFLGTSQRVQIDDTNTFVTYTSNFWTPSRNIMYLTSEAYSTANNPNFVFYENRDGFNFLSLDTLYDQLPVANFTRDSFIRETKRDGSSLPNAELQYSRILDMSTNDFFNYFERLELGMYGSAMYHYDIQAKKFSFLQRNTKLDYEKGQTSLNLNSAIKTPTVFDPKAKMFSKIVHKNLFPNTVPEPLDIDMKRFALLKKAEAFKTNIRVFGKASYKVGDVINLTVYKNESLNKSNIDKDTLDPLLSGNYLISALSHEISNKTHYCNMELIRDSYSS